MSASFSGNGLSELDLLRLRSVTKEALIYSTEEAKFVAQCVPLLLAEVERLQKIIEESQ